MPLDQEFLEVARKALSPTMGTENMAPLLYSIVRFTRPQNVLEIGAGYTTLFLLQAMADNFNDYSSEIEMITAAEKSQRPDYFKEIFEPSLHCVDNMSHPDTSAEIALEGAKKLGIDRFLKFHHENSQDFISRLQDSPIQFDLVWLDAGNYFSYVEYSRSIFPFVNPDGGHILIHSTETNMEAKAFVRSLKLKQATVDFNNLDRMYTPVA